MQRRDIFDFMHVRCHHDEGDSHFRQQFPTAWGGTGEDKLFLRHGRSLATKERKERKK